MPVIPNMLVIMCDQLKATATSLYGNRVCATPSLEALAVSGTAYDNAITPQPLCVPARVSLWTGQCPHTHGSRRNQIYLSPGRPHAFSLWKQQGYHCGFIGKNHCFQNPRDLSLFDTWNELDHLGIPSAAYHAGNPWCRPVASINAAHALRNAMPRQTPSHSYAVSDFPEEMYGTNAIADQLIHTLGTVKDRPFAFWVSFPDPHSPTEVPRRYADLFPPESIDMPPRRPGEMDRAPERTRILSRIRGSDSYDEEHTRRTIGVYYAMTRMIDDALGRIMSALERLGLCEKTLVVFTSDHGDFTGEHGIMDKGGAFYDCLVRVPLVISWPGTLPAGRRDNGMANLIDIVPTLLTLQGLPVPDFMQGKPLPTVTSAAPRDATFSEYGAGGRLFHMADAARMENPFMGSLQWREAEGRRKMIRTADWKFIHDPMGDCDELYDLKSDPWELSNLAGDPAYSEIQKTLTARMLDWCMAHEDPHPVPLPSGCAVD